MINKCGMGDISLSSWLLLVALLVRDLEMIMPMM